MLALGNAEGFNFRTPIWLRICATPRLLTWAWAFRLLPFEKLRAAGEVEPWGGHPASPRCTAAAVRLSSSTGSRPGSEPASLC